MPTIGGQFHLTIASLWISHLVDNLPLSPLMVAHIASSQLSHPRKIAIHPGFIISRLSQLLVNVTCCAILTCYTLKLCSSVNFFFQCNFDTLMHLIIIFDSASLCTFSPLSSSLIMFFFGNLRAIPNRYMLLLLRPIVILTLNLMGCL